MAFSVADGERDGPERRRNAVEDMEDSQMAEKASLQQVSELVSMFSRGVYDAELAQGLIEKKVACVHRPLDVGTFHVSYAHRTKVELEKEFDHVRVSEDHDDSRLYDGRPWEHYMCDFGEPPIDTTDGVRTFALAKVPVFFDLWHIAAAIDAMAAIFHWMGYRFATHVEAIAFAKARPEFQRTFRINALGSFIREDDGDRQRVFTALDGYRESRELSKNYDGNDLFIGRDRLLLVRS